MPSERPAVRFRDIVEQIERTETYVAPVESVQALAADRMRCDAVERCLERICEAARKLGPIAEELAPDQPWASIRGFGNLLRHECDRIDPVVLWLTIREKLPELKAACLAALERLEDGSETR